MASTSTSLPPAHRRGWSSLLACGARPVRPSPRAWSRSWSHPWSRFSPMRIAMSAARSTSPERADSHASSSPRPRAMSTGNRVSRPSRTWPTTGTASTTRPATTNRATSWTGRSTTWHTGSHRTQRVGSACLLQRHRRDGRADRARHLEAGSAEQALPDAVLLTVGGKVLEVEHLAQGQSHVADGDLVERDVPALDPAGPDLARPVVEGHGRNFPIVQPLRAGHPEAGLVPHEVIPVPLQEPLVGAGAHEQDVARLHVHPLSFLGCRQVVPGYLIGVFQPIDPLQPGDVEHDAAGDQPLP